MVILNLNLGDENLDDRQLRESISKLTSSDHGFRLLGRLWHLMQSRDLCFALSPRLSRKLKAFARDERVGPGQQEIDEEVFLKWLEQRGKIEPDVHWQIETLPDNGGIYQFILKGGKKHES